MRSTRPPRRRRRTRRSRSRRCRCRRPARSTGARSHRPSGRRRPSRCRCRWPRAARRVWKNTRAPSCDLPAYVASNWPLPPTAPVEIRVVVPAERWYTSRQPSVSPDTSDSAVSKKTFEPSWEIPLKITWNAPLPPAGPVDMSVVAPLKRSYRSCVVSVSAGYQLLGRAEEDPRAGCRVRGERCVEGAVPSRGPGAQQRRRGARPLVDVHPRVGVSRDQGLVALEEDAAPIRRSPPELAADCPVPPGRAGGNDLGHVVICPTPARTSRAPSRTQQAPLRPSSIHPQSQRRRASCFY